MVTDGDEFGVEADASDSESDSENDQTEHVNEILMKNIIYVIESESH